MSTITIEQEKTRGPGEGVGGDWRVVVLNDSHNTFDHVASTLAKVIPSISIEKGYQIAEKVHNAGLALVWSGHKEVAELYWEQLDNSGLTMAPLERD